MHAPSALLDTSLETNGNKMWSTGRGILTVFIFYTLVLSLSQLTMVGDGVRPGLDVNQEQPLERDILESVNFQWNCVLLWWHCCLVSTSAGRSTAVDREFLSCQVESAFSVTLAEDLSIQMFDFSSDSLLGHMIVPWPLWLVSWRRMTANPSRWQMDMFLLAHDTRRWLSFLIWIRFWSQCRFVAKVCVYPLKRLNYSTKGFKDLSFYESDQIRALQI